VRTQNGGVAVPRFHEQEPLGWRELCAKLRTETDPEKFQNLVDEINRLLTAYEKEELQLLE
jgi:hypothetical protein